MLRTLTALCAVALAGWVAYVNRDHEVVVTPGLGVWANHARTVEARPGAVSLPRSEEELRAAVAAANGTIKAVGGGHSFTALAAADGPGTVLLSLDRMRGLVGLDAGAGTAEFQAGARVGDVNEALARRGFSLPTSASLIEQSLGGLLGTDTHGSSAEHSGMAGIVVALRVVDAAGRVHVASRDENADLFDAARCGLGVVGVLSTVTLRVVPARRLRKVHSAPMPIGELPAAWEAAWAAPGAESVTAYWIAHTGYGRLITLSRARGDEPEPGLLTRLVDRHLTKLLSPIVILALRWPSLMSVIPVVAGRQEIVDASHEMLHMRPPGGYSFDGEVFVPAGDCLRAFRRGVELFSAEIEERGMVFNGIMALRRTGASDTMLSHSAGRPSCALDAFLTQDYEHTHSAAAMRVLEQLRTEIPGSRFHWGKHHAEPAPGSLRAQYPRLGEFMRVRERVDPGGKFLNAHARSLLGLDGVAFDFEVSGTVQGVFFRATTRDFAASLGGDVTGTVRNTHRGTVVGTAEGPRWKLDELRHFLCEVGSEACQIESCQFRNERALLADDSRHAGFEVDYEDAP